MLRLVSARTGSLSAELRRVAIWGLEAELATYIERQLRARWPNVEVQHVHDASPIEHAPADLWICGVEPPAVLRVPTLWLGEVDRSRAMVKIGDRLWKCSTPVTGRQLLRSLDEMRLQLG